jgi:ribosomal protein L15E
MFKKIDFTGFFVNTTLKMKMNMSAIKKSKSKHENMEILNFKYLLGDGRSYKI